MTNRFTLALLPLISLVVMGCPPVFTDGECIVNNDCFPAETCIQQQCVPNLNNQNNRPDMPNDDMDAGNDADMSRVVASVEVTPASVTLDLTQTATFIAQPKTAGGEDLNRPVSWSISNSAIATISTDGVVQALAPGEATITATSDGVDGRAVVKVQKRDVATVMVVPVSSSLGLGKTLQLAVTVLDANGDELFGRPVVFTSSQTSVATVLSDGLVSAQGTGVATITCDVEGVSGTSTITVVAAAVDRVEVTPSSVTIEELEETLLSGQLFDANNQEILDRTIIWRSSDTGVATVGLDGTVTGVSPGMATITGTSEGKSDSSAITVVVRPVDRVLVTPNSASLIAGETQQLSAETRAANGDDLMRPVVWTTSAPAVATVDSSGFVTSLSPGAVVITATSEGVLGTSTLSVAPVVDTVFVSPSSVSLVPSQTASLTATPRDADGNDLGGRDAAVWASSDAAVATVDNIGTVTAVTAGSATITAAIEGVVGSAAVTVSP